jgi:hypothetical protein
LLINVLRPKEVYTERPYLPYSDTTPRYIVPPTDAEYAIMSIEDDDAGVTTQATCTNLVLNRGETRYIQYYDYAGNAVELDLTLAWGANYITVTTDTGHNVEINTKFFNR